MNPETSDIQQPIPDSTTDISHEPSMPPNTPSRIKIRTGRSFPYGTALIALIVIAVCAGALYAFAGAKVEITPASQSGTVTGEFTATSGTGDLPFTVVTVDKTASAIVPAETTQQANDSAQGTITISNAQKTPQTLINSTRFQTTDGLIFHIHAPITIPAAGTTGPGTITAPVFADQPGQKYNVGPTSFTVPGLKGGASYTLVTAISSAPMMGGFTGTRASVSQTTDDSKHATLQAALASSLQSALNAKIPSGYVVINGGSTAAYQALPDTATTTTSVSISESGTITAVAFPGSALAKAIAYKIVGTYAGEPVTLGNVSSMTLNPTASSTNPSSASTYQFSLAGNPVIIWTVDPVRIAGAVAGKSRTEAQNILQGFPEVDKALLILRPFWAHTFPQDPTHIKVTVTPPSTGSKAHQ